MRCPCLPPLFAFLLAAAGAHLPAQLLEDAEIVAKGDGKVDDQGQRTGAWTFARADGSRWVTGSYDKGAKTGVWQVWHPDKWLQRELTFADGGGGGTFVEWAPGDGKTRRKLREGAFLGDRVHGVCTEYGAKGLIAARGPYKNGHRSGRFETFDAEGRLRSAGVFRGGKRVGEFTEYTIGAGGKPYKRGVGAYSGGKRQGPWTYFFPNGKREAAGEFDGGIRTGIWEYWFDNGNLQSKGGFEGDEWTGPWEIYHRDGWLESRGMHVKGRKEGPWEIFQKTPSGRHTLRARLTYLRGLIHGESTDYHPNGKVEARCRVVLEQAHGTYESFWPDGKRHLRAEEVYGEYEGKYEEWDATGQLRVVGAYKDGLPEGHFTYFHANGQKAAEGRCTKGKRQGPWRVWREDGAPDWRATGTYVDEVLTRLDKTPVPPVEGIVPKQSEPWSPRSLEFEDSWETFEAWSAKNWVAVHAKARALIEARPADHVGYTLAYRTQLEADGGPSQKTFLLAQQATRALGEHPVALANFLTTGLFGRAGRREFTLARHVLTPDRRRFRRFAPLRIAELKVLDALGEVQQMVAAAHNIVDDFGGNVTDLYLLAQAITELDMGIPLGKVARRAIDKVLERFPNNMWNRVYQFRILNDLQLDPEGAKVAAARMLEVMPDDELNDFAWALMVQASFWGHYDALALAIAERMIQNGITEGYAWDTVALAMHLNGKTDRAIEYARRALATKPDDPGYLERLKVYERAKTGNK